MALYVSRRSSNRIVRLCQEHHVIQGGAKLFRIGTGWLHWESTVLRRFYDVEITLFDVQDNRQLGPFKQYCAELGTVLDQAIEVSKTQQERVHRLLDTISLVSSFEQAYALLEFHYLVEPSGRLQCLPDGSFDAIFSRVSVGK